MRILLLITVIGILAVSTASQEPCPVDSSCGGIPRWSEHGNVRWRDERARLDHLATQFRKSSDHVIYFLIYPGLQSCKDEAKLRALRAKSHLVKRHSISPESIIWKVGMVRPDLSVQIWLLPKGRPLPEPETFGTIDTRLHKKCKKID